MTFPARHSVAFVIEGYTRTACHVYLNTGHGSLQELSQINRTDNLDDLAAKHNLVIIPIRHGLRRAINCANDFTIHDISQTPEGIKNGFKTKLVYGFKVECARGDDNFKNYSFSSELSLHEMEKLVNANGAHQVIVEPAMHRPTVRTAGLGSPDSLPKRHAE